MPLPQVLWVKEKSNVGLPVGGFMRQPCTIKGKPWWTPEEVEEGFWKNARLQVVRAQEVSVAELGGGWCWCGSMLSSVNVLTN